MTDPYFRAQDSSHEQFFADYRPEDVTYVSPSTGVTTLFGALGNVDLDARYAIANRLLDEGADPTFVLSDGVNALHTVLGMHEHDFVRLAALLQRLLDGGADVNLAAPKFGTPLQMVAAMFNSTTDERLAPVYDVLFARDDLDPLAPDRRGLTSLYTARKTRQFLPGLLERMETHLQRHGIPVPPEESA